MTKLNLTSRRWLGNQQIIDKRYRGFPVKNRETWHNCRLFKVTKPVADNSKAIYTVAMLNERRMIAGYMYTLGSTISRGNLQEKDT